MKNLLNQLFSQHIQYFANIRAIFKNIIFFTAEGKRVFSTASEFKEHEFVKNGEKIKESHQKMLQMLKLREDTYLIEYPHPMCFCIGYNFSLPKGSHAAIFMSQGLYELDKNAFLFLLKHETSHIRFSDVLMRSVIATLGLLLCGAIASLFLSFGKVAFLSFCFIPSAYHYLGGLWMRFCESRADRFAMKHGEVEEIKGGIRYFSAMKQYNAELSPLYPIYTNEGELAKGFHYPKIAARIQALSNEVKKRTGSTYELEQDYIDQHIDLLKANDAKIKEILSYQPPIPAPVEEMAEQTK